MTTRVPVQSLWRGLIYRRRTLAELAAERGDNLIVMRGRSRSSRAAAARRGFALAAAAEGHTSAQIGRFIGRSPWAVVDYRRSGRARG